MWDRITPVVLTYNEEPNIARSLAMLGSARQVLVVDSGSCDRTVELAESYDNTTVIHHAFENFADQWRFAIQQCGIESEWMLALDADYVLTPGVVEEIASLEPPTDVSGYRVRFRYCIDGKPLRGSLYPPSIVLMRVADAHYEQDGHCYRGSLRQGRVAELNNYILHDDRKPLSRWLSSQERYAREEAAKLRGAPWRRLSWPDRIRKLPFLSSPLVLGHCLVAKGCLLDGRPGLQYSAQRVIAEMMISLKLLEDPQPSADRP